jgi:hypothetical protein
VSYVTLSDLGLPACPSPAVGMTSGKPSGLGQADPTSATNDIGTTASIIIAVACGIVVLAVACPLCGVMKGSKKDRVA